MRGQLSIEYLSVMTIFLMIFTTVSLSIMQESLDNLKSIQYHAIWKGSKTTINSAIQVIKFHPGTSKIVYIRVPPDCNVVSSPTTITLNCPGSFSDTIVAPGRVIFSFPKGTPRSGELVPVVISG